MELLSSKLFLCGTKISNVSLDSTQIFHTNKIGAENALFVALSMEENKRITFTCHTPNQLKVSMYATIKASIRNPPILSLAG